MRAACSVTRTLPVTAGRRSSPVSALAVPRCVPTHARSSSGVEPTTRTRRGPPPAGVGHRTRSSVSPRGTTSPITGCPGSSPTTSRPPEVWASARSSSSSSSTSEARCGRTQSRLRRLPPGTNPSASDAPGPVDVRHRGGVEDRGRPARPHHLHQVAEQPEAGDVGGRPQAGGDGGGRGVLVEGAHRRDRLLEPLAGRLVPVVEDAEAERLGEGQRQAGLGGVVAQQPLGVGEAGDGQAVLRLRVVDAVPAGEVGAGFGADASAPPRITSAASSKGSLSRGQPSRLTATTGVPPIA